MPLWQIFAVILLPSVIFGFLGYFINGVTSDANPGGNLVGSDTTDAFLFGCVPIIFFYGRLLWKSPEEEKKPIAAMLAIFAVVIAFWAVFKQNGSTLNTWADEYTDREVPAAMLSSMQTLQQVKKYEYVKDSIPQKGNKEITFDYPAYFSNMAPADLPKEGETIYAFNTNLFQSVNPFWVVAFTPLVVAFFGFLKRRGREPSVPAKIAFGLLISALSCLVMVGAVYASDNGAVKSSAWWFISSYAVITIGELFLSPMGLSLVSKLSPPRLTALMMGGWFLATSIGNKLSGVLSSLWESYDDKADFFYVNFLLLGAAALLMFAMLKWLNKIFKAHT
jgi:POT family proton-dependent oligopeptide transporter